jgi:polysaccharide biosynthesis protein PslG
MTTRRVHRYSSDAYFLNASLAKGLKPLITLCYGYPFYDNGDKPISAAAVVEGFTRYAEYVVRHFKGSATMYQVGNEWDNGVGNTTPGTAATYVNLLKAVYPRLKAIDPNLVIVGGSMSGGAVRGLWFGEMLAAGTLSAADVIFDPSIYF